MVPGFYFSQISNLKSPIRGFIFRKPGFIFRKISHILVCFYTVNSQKCPKYPKIFARSARGFIFRKSQISNSRFGVLFFANLKYKIPYRGFKKGGGVYLHHGGIELHVVFKIQSNYKNVHKSAFVGTISWLSWIEKWLKRSDIISTTPPSTQSQIQLKYEIMLEFCNRAAIKFKSYLSLIGRTRIQLLVF